MTMLTEIHEQAEVASRLLAANQEPIGRVAALSDPCVDHALIAARGTSDNAARYAQYVWGARNRMSVWRWRRRACSGRTPARPDSTARWS